MEYIDHAMDLDMALNSLEGHGDRSVLNPYIDKDKLEMPYMVNLRIPCFNCQDFQWSQIGSLTRIDDFTWELTTPRVSYQLICMSW